MNSKIPDIDKQILQKLQFRIMHLERNNFKTKKLRDIEMVEKIMKMIKVEANHDN